MQTNSSKTGVAKPTLAGDFWGGLAAMLVALPSSVGFGIVVYTTLGPEYAGQGAMAGLAGAAALGIIAPLCGRTAGLISAPCAPAAAVLSALVAGLLSGSSGKAVDPAEILPLIAITTLLAAALQILYGLLGGGRLIKFIPYPVVSGYLSAVSLIIAIGQLPKLLGLPKGTALSAGLFAPASWQWQGVAVGLATISVMAIAPRFTRQVPATILGLTFGLATYFALACFDPRLLSITANPLVIGHIQTSGSFIDIIASRAASLTQLELPGIRMIIVPAITLSILLSIDTLKTCVALDALTRSRHHSNRELIGQGIGNLCTFMLGGLPGAGTMGATLVNLGSGGKTPRAGIIEGIFVVLALLYLSPLIAWVPIGALAGILMVIAWRMFDRSMFNLLGYPAGRLDFAVIAAVMVVALTLDLIAASGAGIALAILLFIREQVKSPVIRRKRYLSQMSSQTRRSKSDRQILSNSGNQGVFCELQGNLFFGTTDQLFTQLEGDLKSSLWLLLDMRHVRSLDYTAVHLFEQMNTQLAERGGRLLFCGMPSSLLDQRNFERYLAQMGIIRAGDGVMILETRESGLEWIEQRILENAGVTPSADEPPLELGEIELFRDFDQDMLQLLSCCIGNRSLKTDERLFALGDQGDELYLVRKGSLRVMLPMEGGKRHQVATIGRGGFTGELSFLDRNVRSADVEAKEPAELFVLSRNSFDEVARNNPQLGVRVIARLAVAIADRLRQTDRELSILEER